MRTIPVRHPKIEVKLFKNVGRNTLDGKTPVSERYAGQRRAIDLTPYLGELGAVQITKSVREPAGAFSITFADRIANDERGSASDTVYGLVEPMDVVVIMMAGDAHASASTPVMMRGIVSSVQRSETMGGDGRPQRAVTISGQDYGKIWQIMQVFYMPHIPADAAALLTSFPFFARYGLTFNTMPSAQFVQEIVDKILNGIYISNLQQQGGVIGALTTDIQVTGTLNGAVSAQAIGDWGGGTIYSLLSEHCDVGSWNELFIEDREDGPYVVYRPNPFVDADGVNYSLPIDPSNQPEFVKIGRADVVSLTASRSDSHVANYFWVDAPRFNIQQVEALRAMATQGNPDTFYVTNYGNVNPGLYGTRKMWEQTNQGGAEAASTGIGVPDGEQMQITDRATKDWMDLRRVNLIEQNKDNILFETGSMRIKGNDAVRAGRYVTIQNGDMQTDYYAVSVQHDYAPFVGYFTTVNFERGRGFIDRIRRGSGVASPYMAEMSGNDV